MATGFGIIGCGLISNFHARAIEDVRAAKLVACYDTVAAAADRLAESTGCKAYHDLDEMLADPALDVVTIAAPQTRLKPDTAILRGNIFLRLGEYEKASKALPGKYKYQQNR